MKQALIVSFMTVVAAAAAGCSFAVRDAEMYRNDTAKLFETKRADIKSCYDAELKRNPRAKGDVTVSFLVLEDTGRVVDVVVDKERTTASDEVASCVVDAIDGLVLTPPDERKGKGTFTWTFDAEAGAPPPA
ncbi:AgmX/PglI C-terminal domain-containing protein [Sorangium sp. So ce131]|uniref:AgmX/PglI C-terminal domain-containing protein n=1 Tax=Sorangium sp. So ce131 TaxID=3133282 RepID=UPI003F5FA9E2